MQETGNKKLYLLKFDYAVGVTLNPLPANPTLNGRCFKDYNLSSDLYLVL